MLNFEGKVAIITGAGSGIGKDVALTIAKQGAQVVVVNRSEDKGENTVKEIIAMGGEAIFVQADVTKAEDVQRYVNEAVKAYGRIDLLLNNAGIVGESKPLADYDNDVFDQVINTNIKGVYFGMKYVITEMLKTGGGAIVNTSSILGTMGCQAQSAYSASKHAIIGLTKTTGTEYGGAGIRVNAVCPGFVETDMALNAMPAEMKQYLLSRTPMKRLATLEDVTNNILFLLSDSAKYINGTAHIIDGGLSATSL